MSSKCANTRIPVTSLGQNISIIFVNNINIRNIRKFQHKKLYIKIEFKIFMNLNNVFCLIFEPKRFNTPRPKYVPGGRMFQYAQIVYHYPLIKSWFNVPTTQMSIFILSIVFLGCFYPVSILNWQRFAFLLLIDSNLFVSITFISILRLWKPTNQIHTFKILRSKNTLYCTYRILSDPVGKHQWKMKELLRRIQLHQLRNASCC